MERSPVTLRKNVCLPLTQTLRCSLCGAEITEGEEYWQCSGQSVCAACLREYARAEFAPYRRTRGREERI